MLVVDRVINGERVRLGLCDSFREAAQIVEDDIMLRNTESVERETQVYERVFTGNAEGCMYEITKEDDDL